MRSIEQKTGLQGRKGEAIVTGTAGYDIYGIVDPKSLGQEKADGNVSLELGQGGANVATTIHSLEVPVRLSTTVGTDAMSGLMKASLREKGLPLAAVEDSEYPLPVSSIRIVSANPPRREIIRNTFPKDYSHRSALNEEEIGNASVVFEASQKGNHNETVKNRLTIARKRLVPVVFAPGRSQIDEATKAGSTFEQTWDSSEIGFTNDDEAEILTGKKFKKDPIGNLVALRDLGATNVVVTRGTDGVSAIDYAGNIYQGEIFGQSISGNDYTDGTGAGDRFAGTVVAMQVRGDSLRDALGKASIHSRSVVEHLGAQKGLLKPGELNEIYATNPDYRVKIVDNVGPKKTAKAQTYIH